MEHGRDACALQHTSDTRTRQPIWNSAPKVALRIGGINRRMEAQLSKILNGI
jgi:hypothetical protein